MKDIDFKFEDELETEETKVTSKTATLRFLMTDIEGILDLLSWAQNTALQLAKISKDTAQPHEISKLTTFAVNANTLIDYITKSIEIGEPDSDAVH